MKILGLGIPEFIVLVVVIAIVVLVVKRRNKPSDTGRSVYEAKDSIDTGAYKRMTIKQSDNDCKKG